MAARLRAFFKQETVLCILRPLCRRHHAGGPAGRSLPGYIDLRVLCLLACLMAVVARRTPVRRI